MRSSGRGYTILEVMLFLAITGALFVSAFAIMRGQQTRTQFAQGMRDIESKFRDYINDVSTGYFPTVGSFDCRVNSGAIQFTVNAVAADTTGTNLDCIFLGKAIQAQRRPSETTDLLNAYTVVGKRRVTVAGSSRDTNNYTQAEADPTAVVDDSISLDKTDVFELPWGVRLKSVVTPSNNRAMLGVYGTLSQTLTSLPGNTESGNQQLRPILYDLDIDADRDTAVSHINDTDTYGVLATPFDSWSLCFIRNDNGETAQITIGGGNNATTVVLEFKDC